MSELERLWERFAAHPNFEAEDRSGREIIIDVQAKRAIKEAWKQKEPKPEDRKLVVMQRRGGEITTSHTVEELEAMLA